MVVQARTRYNVWDLLGDVGGFNDGLFLLCSMLIGPLSSLAFLKDYIDD